jgi:3-oxoacyl-[acyl-carrier protein] reductase
LSCRIIDAHGGKRARADAHEVVMSSNGLSGHVAIVTGANHGIGAATARTLALRGAAVLLSYLRVEDAAEPGKPERYRINRARGADAGVEAIVADGGRAKAVEADLADAGTAARLFDEAERAFGPVDILVNNATGFVQDTFKTTTTDHLGRAMQRVTAATIDQQFAVDARGSALLIAEFARRHIERGAAWGRIIGLTSGGAMGFPEEVSYGAAKAALENYHMAAAVELAPYGITSNVVYPPVTDTGWVTDAVREFVAKSSDHVHVAAPEDVAEVIAWLCSDAARMVTGNVIRMR